MRKFDVTQSYPLDSGCMPRINVFNWMHTQPSPKSIDFFHNFFFKIIFFFIEYILRYGSRMNGRGPSLRRPSPYSFMYAIASTCRISLSSHIEINKSWQSWRWYSYREHCNYIPGIDLLDNTLLPTWGCCEHRLPMILTCWCSQPGHKLTTT